MNKEIYDVLEELEKNGQFEIEKNSFQHGNTTVLEHSIKVAEMSLFIALLLHIKFNKRSLIRGALLHDYFLYDWHDKNASPPWHGFKHPGIAVKNAKRDFNINKLEENIIKHHMFPLTPTPPTCREAWIVCIADKICATKETILSRLHIFA